MKVLHVATEMAPLSKAGGLGDVVGSLPKALKKLNIDVRVITPAWPGVLERANKKGEKLTRLPAQLHAALKWQVYSGKIWKAVIDGVPVFILENPNLFEGIPIYPHEMTSDSVLPFAFLSFAALELEKRTRWIPDIIHCHDWPSALVPIALSWHKYYRNKTLQPATLFTIHNVAHQGILPFHVLDEWGIGDEAFTIYGLEYFGHVNLLKGAIITSDLVTTVSPRYAEEIQTRAMGYGLDGVLRENHFKLHGVLNGIDEQWSPTCDHIIPSLYSSENLEGKKECRSALLNQIGWREEHSPLLLSISRITLQKGYDILLPALPELLKLGFRCIFIGSGNPDFEMHLHKTAKDYPDHVVFFNGFHEEFSHTAYAGSDMLLMPSLYEPCGLAQLIALRYGTVPIVREIGGLADTIKDADHDKEGYGFTFETYTASSLFETAQRAFNAFRDRKRWEEIVKRGMGQDFSWNASSLHYKKIYESALMNKKKGR
ncbi:MULTISPECIES: glycogen synthase [Aminobacterium]|uniref:glycogen synthase n=1 Tax=Aminobacterium TaxID=81466 RepID=UPI000465E196|nr:MULTISPECIES: glycogen/starch synthase [Aminobacterium]